MSEDIKSEATEQKKGTGKGLIILLLGIIVLLLAAIVVLFFTPIGRNLVAPPAEKQEKHEKEEHAEEKVDHTKLAFTALPEILVNIRSKEGQGGFLKATFVVETVSEAATHQVDQLKPQFVDQFQIYLRELDIEDLKGSAGIQRIRQELLSRANNILAPEKVQDVLIKDFIVQ